MAPVNLKLKIVLDAKDLAGLPDAVKKANEKAAQENRRASDAEKAEMERLARQRIAIQRQSITAEERLRASTASEYERWWKNQLAAQDRAEKAKSATQAAAERQRIAIQRQAAVAEASLVLDKFDRRIAIEQVKYQQIITNLKGNDAAIEAETRRHNAVVGRIQMDKANFPNTPFQQMLGNFNKLNGSLGKILPTLSSASGAMQGMGNSANTAGIAMAGLGGALGSLTAGPLGATIFGITMLSSGINLLIEDAERAANLKAQFAVDIKDPKKLESVIQAMDKFEATKGKRGGGNIDASNALQKLTGQSGAELESAGFTAAALRRQQAALNKSLEYRRLHNEDAKRLDQEMLTARLALAGSETDRALAAEKARYDEETQKLRGHKENLAKAEQVHALRVQAIRVEGAKRAVDEEEKAYQARVTANERSREANYQAALRRAEEANKPVREKIARAQEEEDKRREDAAYQRKVEAASRIERDVRIAAMKAGTGRSLEESGGREQDEIAAFNLSEEAKTMGLERAEKVRTAIHQKYAAERKAITEAENQATFAAGITLTQNIGQFMQVAAGKNRAMAKAGMRITEAAAIASTAAGVAKAFEQSGIYGFLTGAAIAAAGATQVATIEQQISKFARGTNYAPGGMALVGEEGPEMVYLPRGSQVKTASETARMRNTTLAPVFNITMGPGTTRAEAEMVGNTVHGRLQTLINDLDEIDYKGLRRAGRV